MEYTLLVLVFEFIKLHWTALLQCVFVVAFLVYMVGLARVIWLERQINKISDKMDENIQVEKDRPVPMKLMEGSIKNIKNENEPELRKLERKRKFTLEKLPFLRK